MKQRLIRLSVAVLIYLLLQYLIPFGRLAIYPVILFVVYLHELGHSIFAVLTGGSVHGIQVSADGIALNLPDADPAPRSTYSTIPLLRAALFAPPWCDIPAGNPQGVAAPLAPLLRRAMDAGRVSASLYSGRWTDVGTPQRLQALNAG